MLQQGEALQLPTRFKAVRDEYQCISTLIYDDSVVAGCFKMLSRDLVIAG